MYTIQLYITFYGKCHLAFIGFNAKHNKKNRKIEKWNTHQKFSKKQTIFLQYVKEMKNQEKSKVKQRKKKHKIKHQTILTKSFKNKCI